MRAGTAILATCGLLAGLSSIPAAPAQADSWPQKPVRIVVPFPAGGNSDTIARIIAQPLSESLGQPVVIENRAGAAGAIAAEAVARAPADGHTLLMATVAQIAIVPAMTKAPYDPVKDFAPITNIGSNPFVLVAHPSIPARTLGEFVAHVREQPGRISYSAVPGEPSYLTMVLFLKRAGLDMVPVSYKGGPAQMTDLLAGHVPVNFTLLSDAVPHAASGALRLLAVSSEKRVAQLPDVPTLSESGFPGFRTVTWNGLLAPAGTPKEIVARVSAEVSRAMKDKKVSERLAGIGVDPLGNSPEEFAAMIAADMALWGEAVRAAGVQDK